MSSLQVALSWRAHDGSIVQRVVTRQMRTTASLAGVVRDTQVRPVPKSQAGVVRSVLCRQVVTCQLRVAATLSELVQTPQVRLILQPHPCAAWGRCNTHSG